jgi:hypothetical protein
MYNLWFFGVAVIVATAVIHCIFAVAVVIDVYRLVVYDRLKPALVPGIIWAITTLILGPLVAIGYWVVNRSSIATNEKRRSNKFDIKDYLA